MRTTSDFKITYDWHNSSQHLAMACRQAGEHDLPEDAREGQEKAGTYTCTRCGVIKTVKERLR